MRVLIEKGCAAPKPVGADYPAWRVTAFFLLFTEKLKKGGSGGGFVGLTLKLTSL